MMDFGAFTFDLPFLSRLASIVLIDLVLAGDNAVVIAMAVRALPKDLRRKGILFGAGAAVLLRVMATFFVAQLLVMRYVKLTGGLVILWIAVKLFLEDEESVEGKGEAVTVWHAVRLIVIADISMSLDNMLAVGAASNGNFFLLFFGLALSIPFLVLASGVLEMLMERYPFIIYLGAAVLGRTGGEMIMTDPVVAGFLHPSRGLVYAVETVCALGVIVAGRLVLRRVLGRSVRPEKADNGQ
ncbi:MAG: TerC family protein [Nitrospiraceae bacterium]|nr:TerC family protein [Nitrospiraceae bacterium]